MDLSAFASEGSAAAGHAAAWLIAAAADGDALTLPAVHSAGFASGGTQFAKQQAA